MLHLPALLLLLLMLLWSPRDPSVLWARFFNSQVPILSPLLHDLSTGSDRLLCFVTAFCREPSVFWANSSFLKSLSSHFVTTGSSCLFRSLNILGDTAISWVTLQRESTHTAAAVAVIPQGAQWSVGQVLQLTSPHHRISYRQTAHAGGLRLLSTLAHPAAGAP